MTKQETLDMLITNVEGHASSSKDSGDPAFILDLFTCERCNRLHKQLEEIERKEKG